MYSSIVQKIEKFNNKGEPYKVRQISLIIIDVLIVLLSFIISDKLTKSNVQMPISIYIYIAINIFSLYRFNCYSSLWSSEGEKEITNIFMAGVVSGVSFIIINSILGSNLEGLFYVTTALLVIVITVGSRLSYRVIRRMLCYISINNTKEASRVLIVGAGSAGKLILKEIFANPDMDKLPVAIVDDNPKKIGKSIFNIPILGACCDIEKIAKENKVDEIIFSIANIPRERKIEILDYCEKSKCKIKTIPGIYEIIEGKVDIKKIRDVEIEDLLGRDVIQMNLNEISDYLRGEIVLVTGGGGSIGSEICRQIAKFNPKKLVILDIYENNAYEIQQELTRNYGDKLDLDVIIASVRDDKRIDNIMKTYHPDVVFHTAAHKHVPLMEDSPCEAVKNNVFGTINVAIKSSRNNVKKFVLISTDKAVNPTNIMGATKRCCEILTQSIDRYSKTEFVAVRFGNVLGSNGSVIPLFKKQIEEGGPVTVTDEEITRFFMTIPEAVSLVIDAGSMARGGEVFVLDMGKPVKIADLAKKLITLSGLEPDVDIKIEYTGLRPGEKLYEELLMDEEGLRSTENQKIFVEQPLEIDEDELRKQIDILKEYVEQNRNDEVKDTMKKIVTTYVEENEDNYNEEKVVVNS
ncbi:MAG: nucleoside-diphosphate sugar epimerase/dehydratase [Terrisporobacter sp.]